MADPLDNPRLRAIIDRMKAAVPLPPTPGLAELAAQPAVQRQPVNQSGRPYPDQIGECDECGAWAVVELWYDWVWLCRPCGENTESRAWPALK